MNQQPTSQPFAISADAAAAQAIKPAASTWTTIQPRPAEPVEHQPMSKAKKAGIIAAVAIMGLALIGGSFVVVSDMRAKAYQAKLQRESRVVVL